MSGQQIHGMFRPNSLAPDRARPALNCNQFYGSFWNAEVCPRQTLAGQSSWSVWAPCGEMGRRRWTQPVHGSQREVAPVLGRASLPAQSPRLPAQYLVMTPRPMRQAAPAAPARSASVGALRQPSGSEFVRPSHVPQVFMGARPMVTPVPAFPGVGDFQMRRVQGTPGPKQGPGVSQSWQPHQLHHQDAKKTGPAVKPTQQETPVDLNSAESKILSIPSHQEPLGLAPPSTEPASPRPAEKHQQSSTTGRRTQFGLLTPPSQRSVRKSPSTRSARSPTSSVAFPGSFVLRKPEPPSLDGLDGEDPQGLHPTLQPKSEQPQIGDHAGGQEKNGLASVASELGAAWSNGRVSDEIGDFKLSPVPVSPSSSAFASFSPGDMDFGQKELAEAAVIRADAETQTSCVNSPFSLEKTPSSRKSGHPIAPRALQRALWSKNGHLPACVSALAMRDEGDDGGAHRCLRKLEMRVAPCWRGEDSLRDSEHSSLQVSSTQSPSTEENELANRRTPLDSFSSLSSPLDHSSILKDVENISPGTEKVSRKDVEKLPMEELRKRAGALTQKLERRERQCIALREALDSCKSRWHALCPR